jgi:hypothetical protein
MVPSVPVGMGGVNVPIPMAPPHHPHGHPQMVPVVPRYIPSQPGPYQTAPTPATGHRGQMY